MLNPVNFFGSDAKRVELHEYTCKSLDMLAYVFILLIREIVELYLKIHLGLNIISLVRVSETFPNLISSLFKDEDLCHVSDRV